MAIGHGRAQACGHAFEIKGAGGPEQTEDAQKQTEVTNPVHHKSFLGGVGGTIAVVPEAHQQVGAHAHQLPEDIDLQQVGAHDQPQHGAAEQRQVSEKAHIALVVGHVAVGIDHHQQGDGGNERQHHRPKRVDAEAHLQVERARAGPGEQLLVGRRPIELLQQHAIAQGG